MPNNTPATTRTAADFLAQIQEHRQGVDFKMVSEMLAPQDVNAATREAVFTGAHRAAWDALDKSDSERVRNLPAVALAEAKELIVRSALLSLAEYLEEFNANAPERADIDFEIASIVFLLRTTPAATAPKVEGWGLRGMPSTMNHGSRMPDE